MNRNKLIFILVWILYLLSATLRMIYDLFKNYVKVDNMIDIMSVDVFQSVIKFYENENNMLIETNKFM